MDESQQSESIKIVHVVGDFSSRVQLQFMETTINSLPLYRHTVIYLEEIERVNWPWFKILSPSDLKDVKKWPLLSEFLSIRRLFKQQNTEIVITYGEKTFPYQLISKFEPSLRRIHIHTSPTPPFVNGAWLSKFFSILAFWCVDNIVFTHSLPFNLCTERSSFNKKACLLRPGINNKIYCPPIRIVKKQSTTQGDNNKHIDTSLTFGVWVEKGQSLFLKEVLTAYQAVRRNSQEFREGAQILVGCSCKSENHQTEKLLSSFSDSKEHIILLALDEGEQGFINRIDIAMHKYVDAFPTLNMLKTMSMGIPTIGYCSPRHRYSLGDAAMECRPILPVLSQNSIMKAFLKYYLCPTERNRAGRECRLHVVREFNSSKFTEGFKQLLRTEGTYTEDGVADSKGAEQQAKH
ncbi:hypothetical protein CS022_02315 [Veronia nyctiphanis]|uniref:Uncharacterized protein n=1 Tax=Veronia nyctiphanis TaxID=1278244 RepID=A0A4Q0YW33_9GAMM|nr:hypothetical protein [Veronia nyctiphanis]RXJ74454.1 hypothetical protein CS022_02315 [Veronia nyctiphanis]